MKAIILNNTGGVDNLIYTDIDKPTIMDDEVLVKVRAIGINPVDVKARSSEEILTAIFGTEKPVILGWDIAGEVVAIGRDITEFKTGDNVFGMVNFFGNGKAYAEYVAAPAAHLARKPDNMTDQMAAASSLAASTAYQALVTVAQVKKGDKVLIHAASGGVGHFAVQIAKHFGAYVVGTSSAKNRDFVLSLGADEHIDYTTESVQDKDFDIIFDTVSEKTLFESIDLVRANGTLLTITSFNYPKEIVDKVEQRGIKLKFVRVESKKETINAIANLLENNFVKPQIQQIFQFEEMSDAHWAVESGRIVGKIVVSL